MLIGAHVSTSGGLVKAWERGVEFGCDAIQIFNQSPRMWRPTNYREPDISGFRARMADGPIESVVIHAVYLINAASKDPEVREKSLRSLTHALQVGDAIGADGVVFHPGSTVGESHAEALERVGEAIREVLAESESCPLLLEDTAGAGNTLGRDFGELARLLELGGGGDRLGVCLDCCHMFASGYDIRTADKLAEVIDDCVSVVGDGRVRCLHVNDSAVPLGSGRDRHALLPDGELGPRGLAAFLSEPRFEGLPALLEGGSGQGANAQQVQLARDLRKRGLAARRRRKPRTAAARAGRAGRTTPARSPGRRRSRG
jgi:deoxyribonuclease-4